MGGRGGTGCTHRGLRPGFLALRLGLRQLGDFGTLHGEVSAWSTDVNRTQRGVDWQMKVDDARCKLKSRLSQDYDVTKH